MFELSYSAYRTYKRSERQFYQRYVAANRPPRPPQQDYMSVGSAFDVYVKSNLYQCLYGQPWPEAQSMFAEAVDEPHRDFATRAGQHCLAAYKESGAFDRLLELLRQADHIAFEGKRSAVVDGVPLRGIPDLVFSLGDLLCVLDWKVRGYCSRWPQSPTPGYMLCENAQHAHFEPYTDTPLRVNRHTLDLFNEDYAGQLSIGAWLCGVPVSGVFVGMIEELCCKPGALQPQIRVATHRAGVAAAWQARLIQELRAIHERMKDWNDPQLEAVSTALCGVEEWYRNYVMPN